MFGKNGRETVICMGQRNGTVVSKQALRVEGKRGDGGSSRWLKFEEAKAEVFGLYRGLGKLRGLIQGHYFV